MNREKDWVESQQIEVIDVREAVNAALLEVEPQLSAKRLDAVGDIPPGVLVLAEREKLRGILHTLLSNAIRFGNRGGYVMVDVGYPLLKRDRLASAPIISNQMLAILVRRDSERQRATLTDRDIVIDPPLGESSSYDFGAVDKNIAGGEQAARPSVRAAIRMARMEFPLWPRQ